MSATSLSSMLGLERKDPCSQQHDEAGDRLWAQLERIKCVKCDGQM